MLKCIWTYPDRQANRTAKIDLESFSKLNGILKRWQIVRPFECYTQSYGLNVA